MKHTIYLYDPAWRLLATRTTDDGTIVPPLRVSPGDTILEAAQSPLTSLRTFKITTPHYVRRIHFTQRARR